MNNTNATLTRHYRGYTIKVRLGPGGFIGFGAGHKTGLFDGPSGRSQAYEAAKTLVDHDLAGKARAEDLTARRRAAQRDALDEKQ